jgi:hypothetical protein
MIQTTETYNGYLEREVLFPKWKILSFNPTTDTWAEIIAGTYGQTPVDLTPYVTRVDHSVDRCTISMEDGPDLLFHPDGGALRAAIQQGRIIRVLEGFEGLAESEWIWTFSGQVEGTYSWVYQRGDHIAIQFTAFGRGNNQAWKRRNVSSRAFTVGSDWGSMFMNIVKDVMLLEDAEVVVPEPWSVPFDKNSNQVVNVPPWDAMEQLMFGIMALPFFNGRGELDMISKNQNRVTLALADDKYLRKYESKGSSSETINKVIVSYLSNTLSRVDGPDQVLGTATVTTGFFKRDFEIPVYYSDERKTRSDNPRMLIKSSANAGLIPFCEESMEKIDEFHVNVNVEVSVWAPTLATTMLAVYLSLSFFPWDAGEGLVYVIISEPFGRIAQAISLIALLFIMMCLGTGLYEIWGTPYEMVYLEQQAIAQKSGIDFWQEREKTIRNDFLSTLENTQPLAVNELHYEVMKENPRTLLLRYDPRLEPGDVIQLSSTVKIYIDSIARTFGRNTSDAMTMTVQGWRTVL